MGLSSVGIIGMGWVGSSVAISLLHSGICEALLLHDIREEIAEGEVMDLNHGSPFLPSTHIACATIAEMLHCDAIVITAGRGGRPGETRLQLVEENVMVAHDISQKLKGYKGLLIIVANPVDVLTYYYQYFTQIPAEKIIGTGTLLDTARLRHKLGMELQLDPKNIAAQVIGEHGDSEVVLWSSATIAGIPIANWLQWQPDKASSIAESVRVAAYEIIKRKGATNHAIGLVTSQLLKWLLRGERRVACVSSVQSQNLFQERVALSLPTLISHTGVEQVIWPEMSNSEEKALRHSAKVLRKVIEQVYGQFL